MLLGARRSGVEGGGSSGAPVSGRGNTLPGAEATCYPLPVLGQCALRAPVPACWLPSTPWPRPGYLGLRSGLAGGGGPTYATPSTQHNTPGPHPSAATQSSCHKAHQSMRSAPRAEAHRLIQIATTGHGWGHSTTHAAQYPVHPHELARVFASSPIHRTIARMSLCAKRGALIAAATDGARHTPRPTCSA